MKLFNSKKCLQLFFLLLCWSSSFGAEAAEPDTAVTFEPIYVNGIEPLEVQAEQLKPGLNVVYFVKFFERSLEFLPTEGKTKYVSFHGEPVLDLNHDFGENEVFGSGSNRGVGMRLNGLLQFKETGVYDLQARSNDGIIMHVADVLALNDPEQHGDRLSNLAHVRIEKPGWYPVAIQYFQRKGTAVLKLFWQPPGSSGQVPVPAGAYAHLP